MDYFNTPKTVEAGGVSVRVRGIPWSLMSPELAKFFEIGRGVVDKLELEQLSVEKLLASLPMLLDAGSDVFDTLIELAVVDPPNEMTGGKERWASELPFGVYLELAEAVVLHEHNRKGFEAFFRIAKSGIGALRELGAAAKET